MALIAVAGRHVEYLLEGEGPLVVLCSPTWWPLDPWRLSGLPQLMPKYRVLALNHRGVGQSTGTNGPYSVDLMADDTIALMDALGLDGPAHLVGFAIGAVVGLRAALRQPQRVRSLVVAGAGPGLRQREEGVPQEVVDGIAREGYRGYVRSHALNDDFAFTPANYREHRDRAEALADALSAHAASESQFIQHAMARGGYRAVDGAERVQQPALVIVGQEDHAARGDATPVVAAHELASRLPRARLRLVPETAHMLFWESPDDCWPPVLDFLNDVDAHAA